VNLIATIEEFESFQKVRYYTVRLEYDGEQEEETETDKFYRKFQEEVETPSEEVQIITQIIDIIGKRGAHKEEYFRFENRAAALPPNNKYLPELGIPHSEEFALRLYCIWLSKSVVILLNGDIKTTDKAQDCPNVSSHFRLANKVAQKIDEAIVNGELQLDDKELIFDEEYCLYL